MVGSFPMGRFVSVFGKVGYASTTTEITSSSIILPTESTGAATYGAGLVFNISQRVGIRLAYDSYSVLFNTITYKSNMGSLGVIFKF